MRGIAEEECTAMVVVQGFPYFTGILTTQRERRGPVLVTDYGGQRK